MSDNTINIVPQENAKRSPMESRKIKRGIFIGLMLSVGLIQFAIFWVYVNFDSIMMAFKLSTREGIIESTYPNIFVVKVDEHQSQRRIS